MEACSLDALQVFGTSESRSTVASVRNRAHPSVTVRERPSWQKVAVLIGSSLRGVGFEVVEGCLVVFAWTCLRKRRTCFP